MPDPSPPAPGSLPPEDGDSVGKTMSNGPKITPEPPIKTDFQSGPPEEIASSHSGKQSESLALESSNILDYGPDKAATGMPSGILSGLKDAKALTSYLDSLGFELGEEIGRGGMGVVFKAKQKGLNRYCALKIIKPDRLDNPLIKARFLREVQAAAKLSHPNIVTVFLTSLEGPILFLAMEYVPGTTLMKVLKQDGPIPYRNGINYMKQVAEGLQHAFEQGMVHRDIKPSNLMITPWPLPSGKRAAIKLLDMGLARSLDTDESEHGLTMSGTVLGTPDYMAPEQAEDPRLADIRSDLYALGGTMFVVLTGRMMFDATTMVQKLKKHMLEVPPLVHTVNPDVPPELSAIIAKLLEKRPEDRFQTPQELIEALDQVMPSPASGSARGFSSSRPSAATPAVARAPVTFAGHTGPVFCMAVSRDGQLLLSGGSDESIRLWDVESRRSLRHLPNKGGPVVATAFAPDCRIAATSSIRLFDDINQVDLWEVRNGRFAGRLKGMQSPIQCLAFSPDGNKLAAGAEDGAIIIWTLDGQTQTVRLKGHKAGVTAIQFVAGGDRLLTGCKDGTLAMWHVPTGSRRGTMPGTVGPIRGMSSAGSRVALAGNELRIRHRDGSFANFVGHRGMVESVAFSPVRDHIVAGCSDGSVKIWQADNPTPVEELPRHSKRIRAVIFAKDGSVFSTGDDGIICRCFPVTVGLA